MEEPEKSKPWKKPWTTDEIRLSSGNWSLAGDAGLLNHLQQFSQNLLQRTHSTEVSLNKLIEELKTTSTEISNVTNSFLALANTQFVENRVYDDDNEISSEDKKKEEEKIKPKAQQEAEVVARIKEALAKGMALLDSHFDAVDVPASDSEEEESLASTGRIFLEARNPYMMRPLPCLIGSKEFMEDDHVGLGELQSDTEESPDQNLVQSSESEEDLEQGEFGAVPKRPRLSSSSVSENSEPESDRSGTQGKQKKHKVGNSYLGSADALEEEPDMFGRESPPEADVGTVTQRGAHSSFAAELASKLGGVVAESNIAQKQERGKSDNLFSPSSEPEEDNSLFGNNAGKFSGGQGLFDDLDDWRKAPNSLWGSSEETGSRKQAEKDPQVGSSNTFSAGSRSDDLFNRSSVDQADDDDDDIFSTGVRSSQKSASTKVIRIAPSDDLPEQNVFTSTPTEVPASAKLHSQGLFDEVENGDLFKNSDFTNKTGTPHIPKSSSLFDGTDTDYGDGDLFSVPSSSKKDVKTPQDSTKKKIPVGGVPVKLFQSKISPLAPQPSADSSDDVPVESTRSVPISGDSTSGIGKTGTGTFDSSQNIATGRISLFDSKEDELFQPDLTSTKKSIHEEDGSDSLFGSKSFRTPAITGAVKPPSNLGVKDRKPVSLFDDSDSGDDEFLFSSTSSTSSRSRRSQGSGDLLAAEKKVLQKKGLFDDENMLFGASQHDDPGFDIFSGDSGVKNNMNSVPKLVPEEKNTRSSLFDDNTSGAKTVSHGLFDDFSDPSDDIFAIPARTGGMDSDKPESDVKKALKNDLFAADDDSAVDIFQVTVPKVSNNLRASVGASAKSSSNVPSDITNRVSDSDVTNSSMDKTSVTHIGQINKAGSLFDDLEATVEDQKKSENKTSYKPLVSQKSKSSVSKPSLFETSPEESDIFSISSKVSSNQRKTETGVEKLTKNSEQSENINTVGSQQEVATNTLEEKTDQEFHLMSDTGNTSQNISEDSLQAPATTKPEPPRTLNIRKTTDMLFNDEEDQWTTGSLDEKVNGSAVDLSVEKEKVNSNTLSAILQEYSSEKVVDAPDGSIISVRKEPTAEKEGSTEAASATTIGSTSPQKTKSLETASSIRSPRKLFIDPTALLPGAKPPKRSVNSEGGVSFDTPVDTNTVLHSAGKERAKIQVKRRPQSRRARQEALRVSMNLENDDTLIESKSEEEIIVRKESLHNNSNFSHLEPKVHTEAKPEIALKPSLSKTSEKEVVKGKSNSISAISGPNTSPDATSKPSVSDFFNGSSNPLSPSTDEEDFFAIPQDLPAEYGETKEQTSDERKNLFGGAPVISPVGLSARPTLFGDDIDTHSHNLSSNDLFSEITEPLGSSESAPLNLSEPKADLFLERKENTSQPAGTKDLFDKADNNLDDDYDLFKSSESTTPKKSQNIFSSVESELAPDEDLFDTSQSKQQTVPKADPSDKRSTHLFLSTEDELLFSNSNTKELKKNVDNTSTMAKNIETGKNKGLLFSASESSSDDLFSVGNTTDISKAGVPKTSVDLFPSSEPGNVSDQIVGDTSAAVQEQKTSLRTNDNNLFSDITKEKNLKTDLFSSGAKSQVSRTNSGDESEASLFSNKGWSGGSRRISATQSNSLFGDDSPESDDLFASSLIASKRKISSEGLKGGVSAKGSLFEDNDDNIFEANSTQSESKLISGSVLEANEDSDLFSSSVSSKKTSVRTSKVSSTVVQGQKNEESDLFEDPLMVIKK